MDKELEELAMWVVTLYDQANTNQAVEELGSRGQLLNRAIEDLKKGLQKRKTFTRIVGEWRSNG